MAKREHYFTRFECGKFYHIYNRSVDKQPMFKSEKNCVYFLKKFHQHLSQVLDVYTYSLLDNHFHFIIRVKDNLAHFKTKTNLEDTHLIVSKQFRIFFQTYALAFNKQHNRVGTLFQTPFKRSLVNNDGYLTRLIYYIHTNPQKHKLTKDFKDWKWSSFQALKNSQQDNLITEDIIRWFGNPNDFAAFHDLPQPLLGNEFTIE